MKRLLATLLALCGLGAATSIVPLSVGELTRYSSHIVEAHAISAYSTWNPQHTLIFTYTTFHVDKPLKGRAAETITVKQIGGRIGAEAVRVAGVRYFHTGERSVLFLQEGGEGDFGITGMVQGDFRVFRAMSGEEFASNGIVGPATHRLSETTTQGEGHRGRGFSLGELESAVKEELSK